MTSLEELALAWPEVVLAWPEVAALCSVLSDSWLGDCVGWGCFLRELRSLYIRLSFFCKL